MNNKKVVFLLLALLNIDIYCHAQNIFTYGKSAVSKEEFLRMYNKNMLNQKADMSEKALNDYLQLYYKFKIKVAEAEAQKIDTIPALASEILSYKKQLAKSYLADKEEATNLVKEAYERSKKDVHAAHIAVMIPRGITDTVPSRKRIDSIYNLIMKGAYTFEGAAKELSDEKKSSDLGFFTVLQAPYAMETVAYNLKPGEISKPFRTSYGYHIIKKIEERPAKGEVQVAQILIAAPKYKGEEGKAMARLRADSVMAKLKNGENFEQLVRQYSDDRYTVNSEGVLPAFGIAVYPKNYEDAAFALKNIGDYSEPILTEYGYHILKLMKKQGVRTFEEAKNELTKKIEKDARMEVAREIFVQKIKIKNKYKEYPEVLTQLIKSTPDTAYKNNMMNFDAVAKNDKTILEINGNKYTTNDFVNYVQTQTRGRIYGGIEGGFTSMYKSYCEKVLNDNEEKNLEKENTEYAQLVKEYRDGTILYELISKEVWNKATTDTTGLKKYYAEHANKYQWGPSFDGVLYKAMNQEDINAFVENCKIMKPADALVKVNGTDGGVVKVSEEKNRFELDKVEPMARMQEAAKMGTPFKNDDGQYVVYYIEKSYPMPTPKSLDDAKGYVIADFQDSLEENWMNGLKAKYPLKVDAKVLKSLVK